MRWIGTILTGLTLVAAAPAPQQEWSPQPWLDDLSQAHQAFSQKYANIDWLEKDREVTLASLFDRASSRLRTAHSDTEAKAIFDRLIKRVGDGHVAIEWPQPAAPPVSMDRTTPTPQNVCENMGFDSRRSEPGASAALPGYRAINDGAPFPSGTIAIGGRTVGVIRIGGFEPQGSPSICKAALQALHHSAVSPCDDKCEDEILTWSYDRLTNALQERARALRSLGATVLLVDITNNGGGTEWAEAAARILSPKMLTSERRGFVRGPHWSAQWGALARQLRDAAVSASVVDQVRLRAWAKEAEEAQRDASQPCASTGGCALVGRAGYSTGLVGSARAGAFAGKPWADLVFSIAQFPYHDSAWSGPLLVLVDDETWSAAEEFAAVLQDNGAAVIIGSRTGGAGCGHTNGGTPTILKNSGATLELPDCVRFRADGSNEVSGVIPDVLTGSKASDGQAFKARLIVAHLPRAIDLAREQQHSR